MTFVIFQHRLALHRQSGRAFSFSGYNTTMLNEQSGMSSQNVINQGDIYWIQLQQPGGSELGEYPHPYVVIQENVFNHSRIHTVIVCALTSNIKRANWPGNVLLEVGEANLPRQSVAEISKVSSVDKKQLGDYIGSLTSQRVDQILAGMRLQQSSYFGRFAE